MNFLKWAEAALDSVDAQATEKVSDIKAQIQQGTAPATAATKLFGFDSTTAVAAAAPPPGRIVQDHPSRSDEDAPRSSSRRSITPVQGSVAASAAAAAAAGAPFAAASSSPSPSPGPPALASSRSSPLRSNRTLHTSNSATSLSSSLGASAPPPPLPKHNKEPSAKSVTATGTAAAAATDDELLSILNSNAPLVATPVRSASPLMHSRSESPVHYASTAAAAAGASPTSAQVPLARSGSGLLSTFMNRVSPSTSPGSSVRKLSSAARGAMSALVDASTSAAASLSSSAAASATDSTVPAGASAVPAFASASASPAPSSSSASPLGLSSFLSQDTSSSSSSLLQSELSEAREEIASLKSVWHESRAAVAKMKALLLAKEEQWRARMTQVEEEGHAALEAQAKAHALVLDEARRTSAGSAQEVGSHIAALARAKVEHAREVASWEARVARLEQEQLPELSSKLSATEAELRQAHERLESQSAMHLHQLAELQQAQVAREARFESELLAHQASLGSFNHRAASLEENNEEYVSAIASLQRQLEAAVLARDKLAAEERMRTARAELDAEAVANVRAQLEQAVKGSAATAAAAKQRIDAAQQRTEELAAELAATQQREAALQERLSALENVSAVDATNSTDPSSPHASAHASSFAVPITSPLHGLSGADSAALVQSLEERVRSMAESLLQRTGLSERLQAEKTSLKLQLEQEQLRVQNLEQQLRQWKAKAFDSGHRNNGHSAAADDDDHAADLEHGAAGGLSAAASSGAAAGGSGLPRRALVRKQGPSSSYGVEGGRLLGLPSEHVLSKVVGFVDSAGLQVAVLLRRHPGARVAFGVYVALIHLWAAFVFAHFMHEFGHETHPSTVLPPGMGR